MTSSSKRSARRDRLTPRVRMSGTLSPPPPPPTAGSSLQVHVHTLRRSIPGRLRTFPGAYALDAAPDEVDARRFAALAARGGALMAEDPRRAAAMLDEALALWRGDAFGDVQR